MSTPADAVHTIEAVIESAIADDTRISWPNIPFEPPTSGPWYKVDVLWGNGTITTKDGLNSTTGILQLAVFDRKDAGDGDLDTQAQTVKALFNRQRMGEVWFGAASGPVRLNEDSWRSLVVSIPFQVLETVP